MNKTLNECKFNIPKSKINKTFLNKNRFIFNQTFSDDDNQIYTYRFIVWKYGNAGIIESEISLNALTGEVKINCFDYGTRNAYASWYCRKYGKSDVITSIDEKITKEINKLGIKIYE